MNYTLIASNSSTNQPNSEHLNFAVFLTSTFNGNLVLFERGEFTPLNTKRCCEVT